MVEGGENDPNRQHVFTHMNTQVQHKSYPSRCVRTAKSSYIFNTWADGKTQFHNESQSGLTFAAMREAWAAETPPQFRFALKCPAQITHRKRLKDAEKETAAFVAACSAAA